MRKIFGLILTVVLLMSLVPVSFAETGTEYIPAPYAIEDATKGPTEYLDPVFYENADGPTIGVTLVGVIVKDGMYFKDSDNDQELDVFEDWRLDDATRAADLVAKINQQQQIGLLRNQLVCSPLSTTYADIIDDNGNIMLSALITLTEGDVYDPTIGTYQNTGIILGSENRSGVNRAGTDFATGAAYINALNMVSEYAAVVKSEPTIPFTLYDNPRNVIGIPGPNGMAAAVMGDIANGGDYDLIARYASLDRLIWNAKGIDSMYGPQIDLITDPRWNRNNGTYTEVPEVAAGIARELVIGYQGSADGLQDGGIALTVKHFPGDGASENGFESHNKSGEWRIYATPGSLENYQLVAFQAAFDANSAGVMPGYSRPAADARSAEQTYRGVDVNAEAVANVYNTTVLQTLLRDAMGFTGFVNSDSNVITGQPFGVEDMDVVDRIAMMVNAGTDVIGDGFQAIDYVAVGEAVTSGKITAESLYRANYNRIIASMEQGKFENPYRSVEASAAAQTDLADEMAALSEEANLKSVVLMKNHEDALPITNTAVKLYFNYLGALNRDGSSPADPLKAEFESRGFTLVDDYNDADIAFLAVSPILNNTTQMAVIDLVDGLEVAERDYPNSQALTGNMISCTTVPDINKVPEIAAAIHAKGGKVYASITVSNSWILTNLEPYCDGLIGVSDTSAAAQLDVLTGVYNPTGKLPVTMASCNEVVAVNNVEIDGVVYEICVSPNDVPGYAKDEYISADVLALSPSGSYAYQDADGNMYVAWFGLSY